MSSDEGKYRIGCGLETSVRQTYERGLEVIRRESNDTTRCLDELDSVFKALGGSHPGSNSIGSNKIEWVRDLITAYRNIGRTFTALLSKQGLTYSTQQGLTYSTQLGEILSDHEDLLEEFDEESTPEAVGDALKYLAEVRDILREYEFEFDTLSELKEELKNAKEIRHVLKDWDLENDSSKLEKRLEETEDLRTEIGDLERELSGLENL